MNSKLKSYSRRRPVRKTRRRYRKSKRILKKYRKSRGNKKSKRIIRKKKGGLPPPLSFEERAQLLAAGKEKILNYIEQGNIGKIETLITQNNLDINTKDYGEPLLNIAIESGNEEMVRYLLEKGAKVTHTGTESPLMYAVTISNPNINIIANLVLHGGNPFLRQIVSINPNIYATPLSVVEQYLADYKEQRLRAEGYLKESGPKSDGAKEYLGDYNKEENDKRIKLYEDIIVLLKSDDTSHDFVLKK